jgi:malate dehydrogenase (oxaloacetate-decarboxylating)
MPARIKPEPEKLSMSATPKPVSLRGFQLIDEPILNKGSGFPEDERILFGLNGLLPPALETLALQAQRAYAAYKQKDSDIERHIYLRALQDTNETLFYRLIVDHVVEMLPMVYTPVVGLACETFSEIYRRPRGLFLSYPLRDRMDEMLATVDHDLDVQAIVVTDGGRILGLGDQGAGGMGIPIGKLSLYTACGGIAPENTLPITLDVGTNNQERRDDPLYIGWRHARVEGPDYEAFVDSFVQAVKRKWPRVLLQFEDFAIDHATLFLERYRDQLCMFNDDVQGTAAVVVGTVLSAVRTSGKPLPAQRVVVLGGGSAGCGIAEQLIAAATEEGASPAAARANYYMVDRFGLVHDGMTGLYPFQQRLARKRAELDGMTHAEVDRVSFMETISAVKPTILIGVSGQPGLFTEAVIREMARHVERPIIFPLSNPTSRAEAQPADILAWTEGRAIIGTGSPFAPVDYGGHSFPIAQTNNVYIFPGLGLGVLALAIPRVSDAMLMASSRALADAAPAAEGDVVPRLLPPLSDVRAVSRHIAIKVGLAAVAEGLIPAATEAEVAARVDATIWEPAYQPYVAE